MRAIRPLKGGAIFCTGNICVEEGMRAFQAERLAAYLKARGKSEESPEAQQVRDSLGRHNSIARLIEEEKLAHTFDSVVNILHHHEPFPQAVCRHGGPDTAEYDRRNVTLQTGVSVLLERRFYCAEGGSTDTFPCQNRFREFEPL